MADESVEDEWVFGSEPVEKLRYGRTGWRPDVSVQTRPLEFIRNLVEELGLAAIDNTQFKPL